MLLVGDYFLPAGAQLRVSLKAILHFVISPVNHVGPAAAREGDQRRWSRCSRQVEDNHRGQEELPKRHSSAQVLFSQLIPTIIHVRNLSFVSNLYTLFQPEE